MNCAFRGSFAQMEGLITLNVSHNGIQGEIPPALWTIAPLESVDVSYNYITGVLPPVYGRAKKFKWLDLSHNSLTGALSPFGAASSFWLQFPTLEHLYVGNPYQPFIALLSVCFTDF